MDPGPNAVLRVRAYIPRLDARAKSPWITKTYSDIPSKRGVLTLFPAFTLLVLPHHPIQTINYLASGLGAMSKARAIW